jgi:hypothetical protein
LDFWLGDPAGAELLSYNQQDDVCELWPLAYGAGAGSFEREGYRSLLFSPHFEAIRNAMSATQDMDIETGERGISVAIDIKSDGSAICGTVLNALQKDVFLPRDLGKIQRKIEQMGDTIRAEMLEATIEGMGRCALVEWKLSLR